MTNKNIVSSFARHGAGDAHHHHQHEYKQSHFLGLAFLLTGSFAIIEVLGGFYSGSLALVADAGHMLTDTAALGLAYFAQKMSTHPASTKLSFGYTRLEIIAAFVNATTMLVVVFWIVIEAVQRILNPAFVNGTTLSWIAASGLLINLIVARLLYNDQTSLNTRAAFIHVLGDILGSIAAIIAGLVIIYTAWLPIDPILSLFVAMLIVRSTWGVLKDSTWHLLDAVPTHIDYEAVGESLHGIDGIISVHDLHIWNMSPNQPTLMAHVLLQSDKPWPMVLDLAREMLRRDYHIDHITLQPEWQLSQCDQQTHQYPHQYRRA